MAAQVPTLKYYFSLSCNLTTQPVGELADGLRFHSEYGHIEDRVETDQTKYDNAGWTTGKTVTLPDAKTSLGQAIDADKKRVERLRDAEERAQKQTTPGTILLDRKADIDGMVPAAPFPQVLKAIRQLKIDALPKGIDALEWYGVQGDVLSGAALATVRRDGVGIFEARVTVEAFDGYRIHGIFSGVVDFGPNSYSQFTDYTGTFALKHKVQLAVRFEAAGKTPDFAAQKYRDRAAASWKYDRLVRGQFVAVGEVTLLNIKHYPAAKIDMDIHEVTAT
jgi:hypothetical protein